MRRAVDVDRVVDLVVPQDAPRLLRDFTALWLGKRGPRPMPALGDLDPLDMPWALSAIFVLKRRDDGMFAYSLVGEGMMARLGRSLKGKTAFDVFEPDYAAWTDARWRRAADERQSCFAHTAHATAEGVPLHALRILLPLQGAGERVDEMIGVSAFQDWRREGKPVSEGATVLRLHWASVDDLPRTG